ncbi:MAG TPA: 4Fe-4S binding protein [bacterium]|nr:4Fe-4S binding protein [bacterium]
MLEIDRRLCAYCGGCVGVCPTMALLLDELTLVVDQGLCNGCGICTKLCPVGALRLVETAEAVR